MRTEWELKKLEDIIDSNVIGLTKNSSEQNLSYKFKYVKMNNMTRDNCFDLSKYTCVNATNEEAAKYSLSKGDFLFNTRNSYELVGKTCLFDLDEDEVVLYNNNIMRIRFLKSINPRFINYAFCTKDIFEKLELIKSGTTNVSAIYYKDLKNLKLSVPALSEQKRIVKILDEVFATIDKAKVNVKKNLQNAKELFESYLQNVFANKGEDWEEKKLVDVFKIKPPKSEVKEKLNGTDLVSFLPMEDLKVLANEIKPIKERKLKEVVGSYTYFAKNDVLLAKITPCFENGKVGIARNLLNDVGFGSSEYIVFRSTGNVIPEYLYYFLSRIQFREEGRKRMTGAVGHKRVSKGFIEDYILPFPKSLKEQQSIVNKFNSLSSETKKLEAIYQQKLNDLEELKKSSLQKAFNGELTAKEVV